MLTPSSERIFNPCRYTGMHCSIRPKNLSHSDILTRFLCTIQEEFLRDDGMILYLCSHRSCTVIDCRNHGIVYQKLLLLCKHKMCQNNRVRSSFWSYGTQIRNHVRNSTFQVHITRVKMSEAYFLVLQYMFAQCIRSSYHYHSGTLLTRMFPTMAFTTRTFFISYNIYISLIFATPDIFHP